MKKVYTLSLVAFLGLAFASCEQCATCTTISTDPATAGEEIIEEVCDSGRDFDDLLEIYTRAGWDCTEQ